MVQTMTTQITSFVSSVEARIEAKMNSLSLYRPLPEREAPSSSTPTDSPASPIHSSVLVLMDAPDHIDDDGIALAEIERSDIEEQKKAWEKFTRQGPSGQPTFHLVKDPIKFPSK